MKKKIFLITSMLSLVAGIYLLNTPKNAYAEEIISENQISYIEEENVVDEENFFIDEEGIKSVANYILGSIGGATGTGIILFLFKKWLNKLFSKNNDSMDQNIKLINTAKETCQSLTENIAYSKETIEKLQVLCESNTKVINEKVEELTNLKEEMVNGLKEATQNLETLKEGVDAIIATNPNLVKNGSASKYMKVGKKNEQ